MDGMKTIFEINYLKKLFGSLRRNMYTRRKNLLDTEKMSKKFLPED